MGMYDDMLCSERPWYPLDVWNGGDTRSKTRSRFYSAQEILGFPNVARGYLY